MSCQLCHRITGHSPDCRYFHEEAAADLEALRLRVDALEREQARLVADLNLAGPDSACCRARHRAEEERDKISAANTCLRAALINVRGFLICIARSPHLGSGARDLLDEADAIDRVLGEEKPS